MANVFFERKWNCALKTQGLSVSLMLDSVSHLLQVLHG